MQTFLWMPFWLADSRLDGHSFAAYCPLQSPSFQELPPGTRAMAGLLFPALFKIDRPIRFFAHGHFRAFSAGPPRGRRNGAEDPFLSISLSVLTLFRSG